MDKRRFHRVYRSLRINPSLEKEPRHKPKSAADIRKMYLETKISMLEIVQDGLQLKLDMQNAKEEFIGILEGYHNYENYDQFEHLFYEDDPSYTGHWQSIHGHNRVTEQQVEDQRVPPVEHQHQSGTMGHSSQHLHENQQQQQQLQEQQLQNYYEKQPSDPRARVKALYEARKSRMHARRDRLDALPSTSIGTSKSHIVNSPHHHGYINNKYPQHNNHPEEHDEYQSQRANTPILSESEKENYYDVEDRNNNTPTKVSPLRDNNGGSTHPQYNSDQTNSTNSSSGDPQYINMLTTINEENSSSSKNSSGNNQGSSSFSSDMDIPVIPPRCPLIPKNKYKEYLSGKTPPKPDLPEFGEYVTLAAPNRSMVSFSDSMGAPAPSMLQQPSIMGISHFEYGSMFSVLGNQSNIKLHRKDLSRDSPDSSKDSNGLSGFRYAKSNVISEMYTSQKSPGSVGGRSTLDISYISNISGASSPSVGVNVSALLPDVSCVSSDYPLHSTMIGAQIHSPVLPLSLSESTDETDSLMDHTKDTFDASYDVDLDRTPQDDRTTVSEPSGFLRAPNTTQLSEYSLPPKAYDDSYLHSHNHNNSNSQAVMKTPKNPIPCPGRQKSATKQSQIPQLCNEHGVHLSYGGPCLFEDSFDLLGGSSGESDLDFSSVNFNSEPGSKVGSKRSSVASKISSQRDSIYSKMSSVKSRNSSAIHQNSAVDTTDCDSSYLSECMDDTHFTNDFSEAENYTALYDARNARMKMLRRQTGQGDIKNRKKPVALSESDILHDMTMEKHLSLQASRTSVPDIYNLSPTTSTCSSGSTEPEYGRHKYGPSVAHYRNTELEYGQPEDYNQNTPDPEYEEDSAHMDSTLKSSVLTANDILSDEDDRSNSLSHNETIISCVEEQRPVSLCTSTTGTTTTDESPESNGAMTVPVNSPNITDSGGSSSRPNTDSYDYVDVPINIPRVAALLRDKLNTQQHHYLQQQQQESQQYYQNTPLQYHPQGYLNQSRSMQSLPSSSTRYNNQHLSSRKTHHRHGNAASGGTSSAESHKSHHSQAVHSDPAIPHHHVMMSQEELRRAKKSLRYPRSQDSGFATHESGRSHVNRKQPQPPIPPMPSRSHSYDQINSYRHESNHHQHQQVLTHACNHHSGRHGSSNNIKHSKDQYHSQQQPQPYHTNLGHIAISDPQGITRNVVQHSAVARNLNKDRKKALAKKLRQFSNNFYNNSGAEHPQIKTLGHF